MHIIIFVGVLCSLTLQKATPFTLLPNLSISGPYKQRPMISGITTIIAPDTPDFAGRPTYSDSVT